MKAIDPHLRAARAAAHAGTPPHTIIQLLWDRFAPTSPLSIPLVPIESCLVQAFGIPLRTIRDIEGWNGFTKNGTMTDQDIDALLAPGIAQYLEEEARLPIHDLYGFADASMETVQAWVTQALNIPLRVAYHTHRGGDYYCAARGSREGVVVQHNFDSTEQAWMEETLPHYAVLLYIRIATIDRANHVWQQLRIHAPAAVHVRRTIL